MDKKVVLWRTCWNGDGRMAYQEQVAIDSKSNLYYRVSQGGNCEYGDWYKWLFEEDALAFIFGGNIALSPELITELKKVLAIAPEAKEQNMKCY